MATVQTQSKTDRGQPCPRECVNWPSAMFLFLLTALWFKSSAAELTLRPGESTSRVVIVEDPEATDAFRPRPDHIREMMTRGLTNLTRTASVPLAWRSLISTQDIVAIKVFSAPGA